MFDDILAFLEVQPAKLEVNGSTGRTSYGHSGKFERDRRVSERPSRQRSQEVVAEKRSSYVRTLAAYLHQDRLLCCLHIAYRPTEGYRS